MTNPINLELRNIKFLKSLSEETPAYTATVYLDGKPLMDVSNDGHGGGDRQSPPKGSTGYPQGFLATLAQVNAEILKSSPEFAEYVSVSEPIEQWCQQRLYSWLNEKAIKASLQRSFKKEIVFTTTKAPGVRAIPFKNSSPDAVIAHVQTKYPDAVIFNALPLAEAIERYLAIAIAEEAERVEKLKGGIA